MKQTVIGVFEDDKIDRFIYERLFSHYTDSPVVHVFDNAKEGIDKARKIGFDMVYIDLHFWEDFGGELVLKELRQVSDRDMITLAMTSLLQAGDHERVTEAGFDLCMEKADFFRGVNLMQLS